MTRRSLLPRPDARPEDGLIGLNLGFGDDDLWGQDPATVADEMSSAVRRLSSQGHRFVGILMNRDDKRWTERALNGIPADIVQPADANAAARELARCSVAVVSRCTRGSWPRCPRRRWSRWSTCRNAEIRAVHRR